MGLPPGKTNNPAGRRKGSRNKINSNLREVIGDFLAKRFNKVDEVFDNLNPHDQAKFLIDLMAYALPKFQTIEIESESPNKEDPISHMDRLIQNFNETGYQPKTPLDVVNPEEDIA